MPGYSVSIHRNATMNENGAILDGVIVFSTFGHTIDSLALRTITRTRSDWPRHPQPRLLRAGHDPTVFEIAAGELHEFLQVLDVTPLSGASVERHRASSTVEEFNIPDSELLLVQIWAEN